MRQIAKAGMAAVAMMLVLTGVAGAACPSAAGQHAVLASDGSNPDVFLWDTQARLLSYLGGQGSSTKVVMAHTVLVSAGTIAEVVSCRPREAHPRDAEETMDVLRVRILGGPHRARYGWVPASDAHLVNAANAIR